MDICIVILFLLPSLVFSFSARVYNSTGESFGENDRAEEGAIVVMEVDMNAKTLHWFVDGKQQKIFITQLPPKVQFAVCFADLFIHSSLSFLFSVYSALHVG